MELRHLRYFKIVAELQHFHNAAKVLCITQPALSNQIKQLEEELGTKLFNRVGRRVLLSESGEAVLSAANQILSEVAELTNAVTNIEKGNSGTIKVGVLQSINALYIRKIVTEFDRQHSGISLNIMELPNIEIEHGVANGTLDIGIGFLLRQNYQNLLFEKLFDENWKLVLSSQSVHYAEDIMMGKKHPLKAVLLPREFETRAIVDAYFVTNKIQHSNITEVNSIAFILELIEAGSSFSILPAIFTEMNLGSKLVAIDLEPAIPPRTIGLFMDKDKLQKISVNNFSSLIRNFLKDKSFTMP